MTGRNLISEIRYLPLLWAALTLAACTTPEATYEPESDYRSDAFLDTLQERTFNFFWELTPPENGLTPDRWPTRRSSSIAAVGFALTSYGVGVERGYVTREEAIERTMNTLEFFWNSPQNPEPYETTGYRGFYYHFLNPETGDRYRNTELSTIDTALLMMGVLFAREYYDLDTQPEAHIRSLADSLFRRVEWDWAVRRPGLISMQWRPYVGHGSHDYTGYNEAMFLYTLALGSPTYPIAAEAWETFTSTYTWGAYYGYEHVNFSPLFGHQYPAAWIDYRGIQDAFMREKGIDYFENSRRATYAQRAYAIENPMGWKGYDSEVWGLTACDGPAGITHQYRGEERQFMTYSARGVSLERERDDGTIAPTAAGGSIAFAPEICVPALKAMRARYGDALFSQYGFLDAFNPTFTFEDVELRHGRIVPGVAWVDTDYLGIDQGPILLMAENYRTGFVWDVMKRSPYIVAGLKRAGFTGGWLDDLPDPEPVVVRSRDETDAPDRALERGPSLFILGSSTAAGVGPEHVDSTWANRMRAYLAKHIPEARLVNLARGGYTTYKILPDGTDHEEWLFRADTLRNISRALERNATVLIVNLPSNDAARGYSVETQMDNYRRVARLADSAGVPIYVATSQPRNLDDQGRASQVALRDSIMHAFGSRAIDVWTGIALDDGRLDPRYDSGDGVHLNDRAHGVLFERILKSGVTEHLK
jgi:lysophospholipase L1-like esterase